MGADSNVEKKEEVERIETADVITEDIRRMVQGLEARIERLRQAKKPIRTGVAFARSTSPGLIKSTEGYKELEQEALRLGLSVEITRKHSTLVTAYKK